MSGGKSVDEAAATERAVAERLAAALNVQAIEWVPTVTEVDGRPAVELIQPTIQDVDLGSLNPSETARVVVVLGPGVETVTFSNIPARATIRVSVRGARAEEDLRAIRVANCAGDLELVDLPAVVTVYSDGEADGDVIIGAGVAVFTAPDAPQPRYRLAGGSLGLDGTLERLAVAGSGTLSSTTSSSAHVKHMMVLSNSRLLFDDPALVTFGDVHSAPGVDLPLLRLDVTESAARIRSHSARPLFNPLIVDALSRVTLSATNKFAVLCRTIHGARLRAPLTVLLDGAAEAFDANFEPTDHEWVRLSGSQGASVLNASGSVELRDVRELQLTGSPFGLSIRDRGPAGTSEDAVWDGTVLTGVGLPRGLPGRRMLTLVAQSYHFTPDTQSLPGRDQTLLAYLLRRRVDNYKGPENASRLLADAEFTRELARICREKGAPGSVATRAAWCAYRLRALKARGIEWAALGIYRLLGYGERPVPAFLLWFALAVALAGPVLYAGDHHWSWSTDGAQTFAAEVGRLLLGPLSGLTRSGGSLDSGGDFAEVAARTLTAIPLITGGIALRNYVKSER